MLQRTERGRSLYKILLSTLVAIGLVGCAGSLLAPAYIAQVSTFAGSGVTKKGLYAVVPIDARQAADLEFREYAVEAQRALALAGFEIAGATQTPDFVVLINYGMGEPRTQTRTVYSPIMGQTGVSASRTSATITGNTVSATTTYTPTYGVVGNQASTSSATLYQRFITLEAMDHKASMASGKAVPVWKTVVKSEGSSNDLRKVMPVMLSSATPYFAVSTGKTVVVHSRESDPLIGAINGQAQPPPGN